jgi:hypothetical protein
MSSNKGVDRKDKRDKREEQKEMLQKERRELWETLNWCNENDGMMT